MPYKRAAGQGTGGVVLLVAGLLLSSHIALGTHAIFSASQTYDEAVHMASGYSFWKSGRLTIDDTLNTPLPFLIASFPLLFLDPDPFLKDEAYLGKSHYNYGELFLYRNRVPAERLLHTSRLFIFLVLSPLLGWLVFRWARELGGDYCGLGALSLYAFSPSILANAPLIAADFTASFFVFLSLYSLARAAKREHGRGAMFLLTGFLVGLALTSKHSAVILLPIMPFCAAIHSHRMGRPVFSKGLVAEWLFALLGAAVAVTLVYGPRQIPLWAHALRATLSIVGGGAGRICYLFGETSARGWWYYFPVAFLMKTPLPHLLLMAAAILGLAAKKTEPAARGEFLAFVLAPAALWMTATCFSHFQIGIRHILPINPLCCVVGGVAVAQCWKTGIGWLRWGTGLLLLWYAAGTLAIQPHYLAYFNEAAGGPKEGYKLLTDSNQDWGQELKALGRLLKEEGNPPIYLSYFGTADPHFYGIRYVPLLFFCEFPRDGDAVEPFRSRRILVAVSGTNLSAAYINDKQVWSWLKDYTPYKVLGYSLAVYDFTEQPDALLHVAEILARQGQRERTLALTRWLQQAQRP
ncbi:MAG: glycosyltransferase family 39 protein [Elusimicrobia bacterium]|nr:glycosyltransferase family 39 protein [Elusimicrobiota bacterium]